MVRVEHWIALHLNKFLLLIALSKSHQRTPLPVTTNAKTLPSTPVPTITTATPCLPNQFQCSDGSCIRKAWRCDGSFDCLDNSDEEKCPCKSFQMTCANGVCINKLWICDGADDCGDKSDEQNCNVPTAPSGKVLCYLCRDVFSFFVAVCVFFFFFFHAWCVDTSCDGWYIIAITKENTRISKKKNKNKNKLHSVWKLHSGKEILEYCKTWTRYQEQNEW